MVAVTKQGLLRRIREIALPPTSRAFRARTDDLENRIADLHGVVLDLEEHIQRLQSSAEALSNGISTHDAHIKYYLDQLYRKEDESAEDSKRRLFASIPPASGDARLFQLALAKLMFELDSLCKELKIDYWLWAGSLIAAESRQGSIPWDDDIDIGMMREDVELLCAALQDNEDVQVTLVYDCFVFCRQVRFSLRDPLNPCFIDICIWDWATDATQSHDDRLKALRLDLECYLETHLGDFGYWDERRWLFAPNSGYVVQAGPVDPSTQDDARTRIEAEAIETVFSRYRQIAVDEGILCDKEHANGIAYAVDNIIYNAPWRRMIFPREAILPTTDERYEGYLFKGPYDANLVCDACYPGWPYLPNDIFSHSHFSQEILASPGVREALIRYIEKPS